MVDHGNEQVEEEFAPVLHLVLHRAAALEGVPSSDDEREVVCTELRVVVRSIGVCVTGRRQDGRALDARLETLLLQSKLLQFLQSVLVGLTVDDSVFQYRSDRRLNNSFMCAVGIAAIFEVPAVSLLVVLHTRVVVTLVEVLKNRREDFGLFVG